MKNISFFLLLFISINIFAQAPYKVMPRYADRKVDVNTTAAQLNKEYNEKCRSGLRTESYWVSYPFDYDSLVGNTASTTANFLFPDSNVYFNFSDGLGGFIEENPFVHLIGDVMNPLSDVFNAVDGVTYDENTPYMVD
ncbi:MAG: hypothetical protein LH473_05900, partial [Chitinophagales bacterium]|nr:hypothetical protein [Chitinophagales bacterium]